MKENINKNMELNTNELEQIFGGKIFCFGIGFSTAPEAGACAGDGVSTIDDHNGQGAASCAFVGLGFGGFSKKNNK